MLDSIRFRAPLLPPSFANFISCVSSISKLNFHEIAAPPPECAGFLESPRSVCKCAISHFLLRTVVSLDVGEETSAGSKEARWSWVANS